MTPSLALALALSALACGDDAAPDAGPADAAADAAGGRDARLAECDAVPALDVGDLDGHPDPLGAGAGEARAGRLGDDDLPADRTGLGTWAAGDFALVNEHVALLVEDVGDSDGLDPFGGKPVAVARVEGGRLVGAGDFGEAMPGLGRFLVRVESVSVLADGAGGGPAVVRAVGPLVAFPALDELVRALLSRELGFLEVAIDYRLAPGDRFVDVTLSIRSEEPAPTRIQQPLLFFVQTSRMPMWAPGSGFRAPSGPVPFLAFVDDGGTSHAWEGRGGALTQLLELSGANLVALPAFTVPPCAVHEAPWARVHLGGPGLDPLRAAVVESIDGERARRVTGRVTEADGAPASGVRVHVEREGVHVTRATTDAEGRFAVLVPPADVAVTAWRRGDAVVGPVAVPADAADVALALAPTGTIAVTAVDGAGAPMPARVEVLPEGELPSVPGAFGEPEIRGGRLHVAFPVDGVVALRAPVGRHRVVVSRGLTYELEDVVVDVRAGETTEVTAALERSVPTPGALCGDFHVHTSRSLDVSDDVAHKVRSAAADGVDVLVRSDHEWVGDFEDAIAAQGLGPHLYGVGGLELTTFTWGHFGVFPLDADPARPNAGAVGWVGMPTPAVLAAARARDGRHGAPVVVINHPRTFNGLMNEGAYFDAAGYDPVTGSVARPALWDEEFGLVEVFNDSDFDDNEGESVRDWFSFLSAGRRVFALGSSDSHHVADVPVGYPRTCVELDVEDAPALRAVGAGRLRDRAAAGRSVVNGGVMIDVRAGDVGPGGEVAGAGARAALDVVVRAPTWVPVDLLRVFVDGELVEAIPLDESTVDLEDPVVRMRGVVEVDVSDGPLGSWVVLVASGDGTLDPVYPGRRPFGVSNPIFLLR